MTPALAHRPPHRELHSLEAGAVLELLGTAPETGLSSAEVIERRGIHGHNRLAEVPREPRWKRFIRQFSDLLILILLAAALVSFAVSGELKTPVVVLAVVLLNAVVGFVQENRAEASLDALKKMLLVNARVRRGSETMEVAIAELVPGDVVLVEAGDRIPADGRLFFCNSLEVDESALTGESHPVEKSVDRVERTDAPLGDRSCMVYKNSTVSRGRGEFVVTATGMETQIGRIATLLRDTEVERTPLQRQLDALAHNLAWLAGGIVALVVAIGLLTGEHPEKLFLTAVALAVASIPEGLPAVTVVTLAVGVSRMARKNAIVKHLANVETLGCTNVICSDKTGTLTMNQMTARILHLQARDHRVSGEGYEANGSIDRLGGDEPAAMSTALAAMALCNDSALTVHEGRVQAVGDPTELALLVLAMKGGIDVDDIREQHPRVSEVPFDSANKYMATVHRWVTDSGRPVVRIFCKGAPDVLASRSSAALDERGLAVPIAGVAGALAETNIRLAGAGMRVLAVAQRDLSVEDWDEFVDAGGGAADLVENLTLTALVGITDPARPEAAGAVADAHLAGIDVKMITGDHALTAAAIGRDIGLRNRDGEVLALTGNDLDTMSDDELDARIEDVSVFARVAPEHKIRLVAALQRRGHIVAMTGDGVNDAPALKKADMGVAMGITGTEVTKEAANMVLSDDNFSTIVGAVRQGRIIYDNIVKFVRFQLSTTLGFALLFLLASAFDIANRKPFAAIAILWVNIIMDGPPAMALGVDPGDSDVMSRSPRRSDEPILTRARWTAVALSAATMAAGTIAIFVGAPGPEATAGVATVAGTMAFNTFVLFQMFNIMNVRSDRHTVFRRATLRNRALWIATGSVLLLQVGVTHVGFMQRLFDTTSISLGQWLVCAATASSILVVDEARKLAIRAIERRPSND